ncbi:uncharacterized protein LY89DRAFT_577813, partial [Mollisia scopiformis]
RMSAPANNRDKSIVTHARVVAHLSQNFGGGNSENHWSVYFLLQGRGSVRMNMFTPKYGVKEGRLELSIYDYELPTSALKHWDYKMTEGKTFEDVRDFVSKNRRHHYDFSGGGSGCRYWCYTIMNDFEQCGYIPEGSVQHLWPGLQYLYSKSRDPSPLQWIEGKFFY